MIENEALRINYNSYYLRQAAEVYKYLNQEKFQSFKTLEIYKGVLDLLYDWFGAENNITFKKVEKMNIEKNNKVVVAFSGGLDSVYQTLILKEKGYDVRLLHISNLNSYTNGQEKRVVKDFAKKTNLPLLEIPFSAKTKGEYKKHWQENPFKDFLIYSACVDYMYAREVYNISCGDDLRLSYKDAVLETNISDARELTLAFFEDLKKAIDFNFISVDASVKKDERIKYIREKGFIDDYYSCVTAGRLNQYLRKYNMDKFNIQLEKYNCGNCRKCCFHSLSDYYYNNVSFPQEYIDHCWNKISIGADNIFFNKKLPLETRIKNLRDY